MGEVAFYQAFSCQNISSNLRWCCPWIPYWTLWLLSRTTQSRQRDPGFVPHYYLLSAHLVCSTLDNIAPQWWWICVTSMWKSCLLYEEKEQDWRVRKSQQDLAGGLLLYSWIKCTVEVGKAGSEWGCSVRHTLVLLSSHPSACFHVCWSLESESSAYCYNQTLSSFGFLHIQERRLVF